MNPSRLSFHVDPGSLPGILIILGAGLLLLVAARRCRSMDLGRRAWSLLALRGLTVTAMALLLLGPMRMESHTTTVTLPDSLVQVSIPLVDPDRYDQYLPSRATWTPPDPDEEDWIRLDQVTAPLMALYKNRDHLSVTLSGEVRLPAEAGLSLHDLSVTSGNNELWRTRLELKPGQTRVDLSLPFVPQAMGTIMLGVRLTCPPGVSCRDQDQVVLVRVVRESLRILHLAGHPSWDLRFLREYLGSRVDVELVSFYILANQENFEPLPPDEVALIPFPTDELFLTELPGFDLIILQDFPVGSYFPLQEKHLDKIVEFVRGGGGLLVLGGARAFSPGGVDGTRLETLLPLAAAESGARQSRTWDPLVEFKVRTSQAAGEHPLLGRLAGLDRDLEHAPALRGLNQLTGPAPGAIGLLETRQGKPLLVAGAQEKGRVAVLGTDDLWRWAFPETSASEGPRYYRALMDSLLEWLTRDPRLEILSLEADGPRVEAGREPRVRLCLKGGVDPASEILWHGIWSGLGTEPSIEIEGSVRPGADGCGAITLPAAGIGGWKVEMELSGGGVVATRLLPVVQPSSAGEQELRSRALALLPPSAAPLAPPPPLKAGTMPREVVISWEEEVPVWHEVTIFLLMVGFLVGDWTLRRKYGMI